MKRILLSFFIIGLVATVAVYATNAFFSDTETSTGNTFTAGAIDLKIDNESYWNRGEGGRIEFVERLSWELRDLTDELFFNFTDMKPGDLGEDTISLHLTSNPAWACVDIDITKNTDESCTEPEKIDDPDCGDPNEGDLAQQLNFVFWVDDGDNVLEVDEIEGILTQGSAPEVLDGVTWALADSNGNVFTGEVGPLEPNTPGPLYYIGKAWCFGELTLNPAPEGEGTPEQRQLTGINCNGQPVNNAAQTDKLLGNISFRVVQARHNEQFVCERPSEVYDYLNIGDTTSETGHNPTGWSDAWVKPGWGGNYGGGSSDTSFRLLMGHGDGCGAGYEHATFTMNAGSGWATKLTLEHLDGSVDDSFGVYINNVLEGSYTAGSGGENWVTTVFPFTTSVTGTITVKLVSTQPDNIWCATWGQVAFSNALLE